MIYGYLDTSEECSGKNREQLQLLRESHIGIITGNRLPSVDICCNQPYFLGPPNTGAQQDSDIAHGKINYDDHLGMSVDNPDGTSEPLKLFNWAASVGWIHHPFLAD